MTTMRFVYFSFSPRRALFFLKRIFLCCLDLDCIVGGDGDDDDAAADGIKEILGIGIKIGFPSDE